MPATQFRFYHLPHHMRNQICEVVYLLLLFFFLNAGESELGSAITLGKAE